jgi:hypothetical protein
VHIAISRRIADPSVIRYCMRGGWKLSWYERIVKTIGGGVNCGVIPRKADPAKRGTVFHPPNELHVSHGHEILSCNATDSTRWLTVRGKG